MNWYDLFNIIEAVLWLIVAVVIAVQTPAAGRQQQVAVWLGSAAFLVFGVTDLLEVHRDGRLPLWLWGLKTACGTAILSARYLWRGWNGFHVTDREFLFGVGCLACVIAIVIAQNRGMF